MVQKWSKGKQKEKVNNMVLFDQATYDKLLSDVPKSKLITPSVLSDRLRVCTLPLFFSLYVYFLGDFDDFLLWIAWCLDILIVCLGFRV